MSTALLAPAGGLTELQSPARYFERNSRSFWFASAFMSREERERVARVYSWCRYTDDLVDRSPDPAHTRERLSEWLEMSRASYAGLPSGIATLDALMTEMRESDVPFSYPELLARGVASDIEPAVYFTLAEVHDYAHLVAGVVGQWLSQLHGVRDAWMLDRAGRLGRAMQMSNILRDVGEDWDNGRLYLPLDVLRSHGLSARDIGEMKRGDRPIDRAYRGLVEELMSDASRDYDAAREAIPFLPTGFGRAVRVAAAVYEGLHEAIRRNSYDNLTRRAIVPLSRKLTLAASALRPPRYAVAIA